MRIARSGISSVLVATIVVVIVIAGAGYAALSLASSSTIHLHPTDYTTTTSNTTIPTLNTSLSSTSDISTFSPTNNTLYQVTFVQEPATCPPSIPMYVAPWSVTLANQTKSQPVNETASSYTGWSPQNSIYSKIVFLVPDGVYNYSTMPNNYSYTPFEVSSGTVSVENSNVTEYVGPAEVYCTAAPASVNQTTSIEMYCASSTTGGFLNGTTTLTGTHCLSWTTTTSTK